MKFKMPSCVNCFWRPFRRRLGCKDTSSSSFSSASAEATGMVSGADREEMEGNCSTTTSDSSVSASFVEINLLREDLNATRDYPDNSIRTAKYTWLSCFPLSLLYQFQKVANIYFLIVTLLSLVPGASPVNPFSTILPLCIVLGAAIIKDLWEDGKRRQSDDCANNTLAFVLRGEKFVSVPACSVHVGDVMLCRLGEEVLADVVMLNSSHPGGVAYIETVNLDGETNAKTRRAKPQTIEALGTIEDIIESCLPDPAIQAYFMERGTTASWNAAAARDAFGVVTPVNSSLVQKNRSGMRDERTWGANGQSGTMEFPGRHREPFMPHPLEQRASLDSRLGKFIHVRSHTYGSWGRKPPETPVYHKRHLTFDERFAVGREMPVPSKIMEMSRRYDEKHMGHHRQRRRSCPFFADNEMVHLPNREDDPDNFDGAEENSNQNCKSTGGIVILGAPPCSELYSWIGQMRMRDDEIVPLGIEQLLPRGCVVRNTEWILTAVTYTGRNTKMLLNQRPKPMKFSVVARRINILNCFLLLVHQSFLFFLCGLAVRWRNERLEAPEGTRSGYSTWYIQWNLSRYTAKEFFGWRYLTNFVLLSYLIPLSLYVTMEFNKAIQMVLISRDRRMANFDEFIGELRYSRPKTSELNCQLAHVRYIFTDKTGTLTENIMTYVGGCTATKTHNEQERPGGLGEEFIQLIQNYPNRSGTRSVIQGNCFFRGRRRKFDFDESMMESEPLFQYLRALALCHSVVCFDRSSVDQAAIISSLSCTHVSYGHEAENAHFRMPTGEQQELQALDPAITGTFNSSGAQASGFHTSTASGVGKFLQGHNGSSSWYVTRYNDMQTDQRSATMPRIVNELKDESKIYEAQSLDEIALVTASRDNLFALQRRSATHMFIKVVNKIMCYEIIAELEFTPQRKLMSILLCRCPTHDDEAFEQPETTISYHRLNTATAFIPVPRELECMENGIVDIIPPPEDLLATRKREERAIDNMDMDVNATHGNTERSLDNDEERPYLLLVKGADSSMTTILNKNNPRNAELWPIFQRELEAMAQQGLRTLVMGQRYLSEREVREWLPSFHEAQCSMHNRMERLHRVYAMLEKEVDLVGTTAVEDRLQDGVPETIKFFLEAEIVVWMLTGDKRETAVTIAGTSGLIDPQFEDCVFHLDVAEASLQFNSVTEAAADTTLWESLQEQIREAVRKCNTSDEIYGSTRTVVLVVDGRTLDIIFTDVTCTREFFEIGIRCRSAVCCRMTPLQKAKVVRMFQKNTSSVALAVGDGANDVSMIQESHIGVGIMGLEGSQAELASDYAIPKFRFLKRLLVVHGRFALYRDAHCITFSLYKNVVLCTGLATYAFFCGFSGMILVESWLLAMFNLFFCSLQPLALGIFDKDVDDELAESTPSLYPALAREHMFFSWSYILKWLCDGVLDGLALFFVIFYTVAKWDELYPYRSASLEDYGTLFFMMVLLLLNLRIAAVMTCYTAISVSVIAFGFIAIPTLTMVYSAVPHILGSNWGVNIAMELMGTNKFWMLMFFSVGVFVVYGMAVNTYIALFWPWANGGAAMRAAWRSPYRLEYKQRMKQHG
ncbi:putative phospholipid transporting ATPase-like protein [Trypanosoma cruzi]|nr:putative phospholipid transporting ATPase-like protein [Trypanosoma cruzi]